MTNRNKLLIGLFIGVLAVAIGASFLWKSVGGQALRQNISYGSAGVATMGLSVAPSAPSRDWAADEAVAEKGMMFPRPEEPTAGETAAEVDQKIIKNGSLHLVVDDVVASADGLTALAKEKGGFVQSSQITERADGTHSANVSIRVPVAEFENTMSGAKALARNVKSDSTTGQDVTEQFSDLQAQLRNAKAQEETYLAVLKQAKSVQDILSVQQYLGSIRSQIESLEGRLKYLENRTSFSTISIVLEEEPAVRAPTKEFRPVSAAKEAVQALVELGQSLVVTLIWLVIVGGGLLIPVGILIAIIVWAIKKLFFRRKA